MGLKPIAVNPLDEKKLHVDFMLSSPAISIIFTAVIDKQILTRRALAVEKATSSGVIILCMKNHLKHVLRGESRS